MTKALYLFNCDGGFDVQIIAETEEEAHTKLSEKLGEAFKGAILADATEWLE